MCILQPAGTWGLYLFEFECAKLISENSYIFVTSYNRTNFNQKAQAPLVNNTVF